MNDSLVFCFMFIFMFMFISFCAGAGLTWAIILQNGASMIEIAWPEQGWVFRFSGKEMTS